MLILTHLNDWSALRLAAQLRASGSSCDVVTVESLSFARRRTHRVSDAGTSTIIELQDGTVIGDEIAGGVLNRCCLPPDLAWRYAAPKERAYATAELCAFMTSWLHGLPVPVRNRPMDESLAGPCPSPRRTAVAASEAGLPVSDGLRAGTTSADAALPRVQLVMLDGEPFGPPASTDTVHAARRMLERLGAVESLVGLDFLVDTDGSWRFAGLTPLPALPTTPDFVDAIRRLLAGAPVAPMEVSA